LQNLESTPTVNIHMVVDSEVTDPRALTA